MAAKAPMTTYLTPCRFRTSTIAAALSVSVIGRDQRQPELVLRSSRHRSADLFDRARLDHVPTPGRPAPRHADQSGRDAGSGRIPPPSTVASEWGPSAADGPVRTPRSW